MDHLIDKFRSAYISECDVSVHESWKVYIPSECFRFVIKSFILCYAKSGYVWNFITHTECDTIFDESLNYET